MNLTLKSVSKCETSNCESAFLFHSRKAINPFIPNLPILYPLKTSENRKVFWCFQGVEKGWIEKD